MAMLQTLAEILSRLYRPPEDGIRQVLALSRHNAEKLPRLPSIAIISITSPERPLANLDGFDNLLRLGFEDVDFLNPGISMKARKKLDHAFTAVQAKAIRSFVSALPEEIRSIIVHCEGGLLSVLCCGSGNPSSLWLSRGNEVPSSSEPVSCSTDDGRLERIIWLKITALTLKSLCGKFTS